MLRIHTEAHRKGEKAWECFIVVVQSFLANIKADNYKELVEASVKSYGDMGCRIYILDAHLDNFKENIGAYSKEQGERFHQDKMNFVQRYQGSFNENMMGDYT